MSAPALMTSPAGARALVRAPAWSVPTRSRRDIFAAVNVMWILLSLFGCGRADGDSGGGAAQPVPSAAASPLELRLEVPAQVRAGEAVPLRLVLHNRGAESAEVGLGGQPIAFDFVVTDAEGAVVWRRLEGIPVEDILRQQTVAPYATLDFSDRWDQRTNTGARVPAGVYRIQGILPVVEVPGGWGTETHTLTIQP